MTKHDHHHHEPDEHESPYPDNPVPEPQTVPTTAATLLSGKQFTKLDNGKYTVTIANPLKYSYLGLPPGGTTLGPFDDKGKPLYTGDECVLSLQPGGDLQVRAKGTAGAWESCSKSNGLASFVPDDKGPAYGIPYAD